MQLHCALIPFLIYNTGQNDPFECSGCDGPSITIGYLMSPSKRRIGIDVMEVQDALLNKTKLPVEMNLITESRRNIFP